MDSIDIRGGYGSADLGSEEGIILEGIRCIIFRYYKVYPSSHALVLMAEALHPTVHRTDDTDGRRHKRRWLVISEISELRRTRNRLPEHFLAVPPHPMPLTKI